MFGAKQSPEKGVKRVVYRDVNSGGSFGASALRREIGIGQSDLIDELEITWAQTGKKQVFKNLKPNQFIKIKERYLILVYRAFSIYNICLSAKKQWRGINYNFIIFTA